MTVPTSQTARLTLRALRQADLDDVVRYAGDYAVSKWLTRVPYPYTRSDAADFLAMDRAGEMGSLWMITTGGALIGAVSVGNELGYWLAPTAWGQGYMTEAAGAVVDAHFGSSDNDMICSSHFVENYGSKRVLEKIGFVDTGAHVHFSQARQENVPVRSMELTHSHWKGLRDG
jgi:RimJ/RimL family protein N-acetyltransferase